jgi:hypothetical protein
MKKNAAPTPIPAAAPVDNPGDEPEDALPLEGCGASDNGDEEASVVFTTLSVGIFVSVFAGGFDVAAGVEPGALPEAVAPALLHIAVRSLYSAIRLVLVT